MSRTVVVTHIDNHHIDLAKQLFSSVHYNAGWTGDLLLLGHNLSNRDKRWFSDRHILTKDTPLLYTVNSCPAFSASKLYIFSEGMKRWNHVIYLDPDIIVRSSIDNLLSVRSFGAVPELDEQALLTQLQLRTNEDWKLLHGVERKLGCLFDLSRPAFNAGVLSYNTTILDNDLFGRLEHLLRYAKEICLYADQTVLNLFFYDRWELLSRIYNVHPLLYQEVYRVPKQNITGINLHFSGLLPIQKPNHIDNAYYAEWKQNLDAAENMERKNIPIVHTWTKMQTQRYERFLRLHRFLYAPCSTRLAPLHIRYRIIKRKFGERFPALVHLRDKIIRLPFVPHKRV